MRTSKFKQVACGIMVHEGKILMGLRPSNRPYGGYWEFPGGSREKNETIEECLKREWLEELNLEIEIDDEIHQNKIDKYHCRFFTGKIVDITRMKKNVHQKIKFLTKEEIKNHKLFETDYKILELPTFPHN
jgi:8-oxo-dGTP pyrophosphatase MutT (NUDIX family)